MSLTLDQIQSYLAQTSPFDQLTPNRLKRLATKVQVFRYRIGQGILPKEQLPAQVVLLYQGQIRLLGYDPRTQVPVTLRILQPGALLGAISLVRNVPCEASIASTEVICFHFPAEFFLALLKQEPTFAEALCSESSLVEVFEILGAELQRQADGQTDLKTLALQVQPQARVYHLSAGKAREVTALESDYCWFVSSQLYPDLPVGSCLNPSQVTVIKGKGSSSMFLRLIGLRKLDLPWCNPAANDSSVVLEPVADQPSASLAEIPYAPEQLVYSPKQHTGRTRYPLIRATDPLEAALACLQMLALYFGIPFRRELMRRVLVNQYERSGYLSLQYCAVATELMGLQGQLVQIPVQEMGRLPVPALIDWQDSFALVYAAKPHEIVLAVPETGLLRRKPRDLLQLFPNQQVQALLLKPTALMPQHFSLGWFWPALQRYRWVLIEVLVASFFVQLFSLANPLIIQVIIDQVLVQNSPDTLHVLGIFLVGVAVFEGILSSLRTYLFADTTNRIDLALGSEVIDHLLRLPLRYFERRPVGELSTRINELENIRRFLTGTALTVVLDAVFSVVYVVVMVLYSWQLTLVALVTVPLFVLLTVVVAPIVRRQLRLKAEHHAQSQSHLVEVLSGIQTVKAQNIELQARWQWQEDYARSVSTGFRTVVTATTAGAASTFLSQLSGLLVIWMGAYLVLAGQLTLGQLIAFRIIANYVTTPLLRLAQSWQSFQEMGLSVERLSDILDTPQEVQAEDRQNIPMPLIQGTVQYDQVTFEYHPGRAPQLQGINLTVPAGKVVGIVGQSGSGKSTLLKLLARLYEPSSGRILVDGYDISKVELYSLRQQVGIVPQETLLFDGTVQENIALTNPEAPAEAIVEAAQLAVAHDFIMALPNGYNTRVGERGSALSGGQRQRIAIARTLLQNPRLLILDEATSALDYATERRVCQNLMQACQGRTLFFITHRLSTVQNADLILVMDQGMIAEQGTHESLMALKGRYYCLFQQQQTVS